MAARAATLTCLEDKNTLSAASKTDLYVSLVKFLSLMWARIPTGNWIDHKAKVAAGQQHPTNFCGFLQISSTIWYPNCEGRPVIVLVRALLYESHGFAA